MEDLLAESYPSILTCSGHMGEGSLREISESCVQAPLPVHQVPAFASYKHSALHVCSVVNGKLALHPLLVLSLLCPEVCFLASQKGLAV